MRKIDKTNTAIIASKYKNWLDKQGEHDGSYNYYYDDIVMNLFRCQKGVCAYTEMFICPQQLYSDVNWTKGRFKISDASEYKRTDHLGELDHFNPDDKLVRYWNWDNLFMVDAKINAIKSNKKVIDYLKPDLPSYHPDTYFEYDEITNRYIPNTSIDDIKTIEEIAYMIDEVLCLNHGVVKIERRNYIKSLQQKLTLGERLPEIDQFFTAVSWVLGV